MSSQVYQNLMRLLKKWPLDSSKKGRDLGELIRKKVSDSFTQGEASKIDEEKWTVFVNSLENISTNKSLQKYPRIYNSTASGLGVEECREIVSTEFLTYLQQEKE